MPDPNSRYDFDAHQAQILQQKQCEASILLEQLIRELRHSFPLHNKDFYVAALDYIEQVIKDKDVDIEYLLKEANRHNSDEVEAANRSLFARGSLNRRRCNYLQYRNPKSPIAGHLDRIFDAGN